jgi:hypothetical protein
MKICSIVSQAHRIIQNRNNRNNQIQRSSMADDNEVERVTEDMDSLSFDPTMKKKKSTGRKKSVAFEDPSTAEVIPTEPGN